MTSTVTYFEISGPDPQSLRTFYAEALGLDVAEPDDSGYSMVGGGDGAIQGGVFDGTGPFGTYAVPYVQVDDIDAAVARAKDAGGEVLVPPTPHGPTVSAHLRDPAGNRIGVYTLTA